MVVSDMWHILFSAENRRRLNTAMICRPSGHHQLSRVSRMGYRRACDRSSATWLVLAHQRLQPTLRPTVELAEPAVAIAIIGMCSAIFFPQQQERHVLASQIAVDRRPVRLCQTTARRDPWAQTANVREQPGSFPPVAAWTNELLISEDPISNEVGHDCPDEEGHPEVARLGHKKRRRRFSPDYEHAN